MIGFKTRHQRFVEEFMEKAGQVVPNTPTLPDIDTRKLRAKLILEEALETIDALGCVVVYHSDATLSTIMLDRTNAKIVACKEPDLVEIIDGCCDVRVVTTGTLSACGIPDAHVQDLVDFSNLAKFAPGGYRREDGKWIKPPDWKPPQLAEVIAKLKLETNENSMEQSRS